MSRNNQDQSNLRTEIAILQKDILAFKPCNAKLIIPALFDNDDETVIIVPMPMHLSITYGEKVIPKGTKLIVQAVVGNLNDIRIIGYYDEPKSYNFIDFIKRFIREKDPENPLPDNYGVYKYDEI